MNQCMERVQNEELKQEDHKTPTHQDPSGGRVWVVGYTLAFLRYPKLIRFEEDFKYSGAWVKHA